MSTDYSDLPRALRHRRSRTGVVGLWKKIQRTIGSPRVLTGLPPFTVHLGRTFWDATPDEALLAINHGDCAYFVAFQIRLDQIDCAMVDAGLGIGDRAPVMRAKYLLEGFRQTAERNLLDRGGKWPPAIDAPPSESADRETPT